MKVALAIALFLVAVGFVLWLLDRMHPVGSAKEEAAAPDEAPAATEEGEDCSAECCAVNEVCPSELALKHAALPAEYFDDEELDRYRGREAGQYTPDEIEQWRDVLYTLKPSEIFAWEQSIKKRGLTLPEPLRDELIMLLADNGTPAQKKAQ